MRGKKYREAIAKVDRTKRYNLDEALKLLKEIKYGNFDETVELHLRLGVDPKKSDQIVRGSVVLPHGTGKKKKVLVFAKGDKIKEAEEAGADHVGGDELIKKIQEGWLDFDIAIATPDMMSQVGRLGRILGPRGLMPNPKSGTVTFDIKKAVEDAKKGLIEFRVDKTGNIHLPVGKVSFDESKLRDNIIAAIEKILSLKPPTSKGAYIRGVTLTTTMSPGVKVDYNSLRNYLR